MSDNPSNAPVPAESGTQASGDGVDTAFSFDSQDDIDVMLEQFLTDNEDGDAPEEASETGESYREGEEESTEEDAGEQEIEEAHTDSIDIPASWGLEAKEIFASLPPKVQAEIAQRETAREQYVHAKAKEAADTRAQLDHIVSQSKAFLGIGLNAARAAVDADFAGVDWNRLQQDDPVLFMRLQGQRNERYRAVEQTMEAYSRYEQEVQAQAQTQEYGRLKQEVDTIRPKIQGLMGKDFTPQGYVKDVVEYLSSVGAPQEHLGSINHGYVLEIVTKAMLYDRQEKARASAAKKVAAAPKVQGVKGRSGLVPADNAEKKLRARLEKNPDDMDALTELLMI